jgi:hypothetical protein
MVATQAYDVFLSMDGAPLMIRFDNDHHGRFDAEVGAVHPITAIRSVPTMHHIRKSAIQSGVRIDAQRLMFVAALLFMTTTVVPGHVQAATPWDPTEPETYICTTEHSAGIANARARIGKPQGNKDDPYVGALDLPEDFHRFEVTITPWDKVPDDVKPAFRERLPDHAPGSGAIYILSLDRRPSLVEFLDDAYIGRAPVPPGFRTGPPDPMEDAIKFNGYANTFVFHRNIDHAFVVFVYQYGFEWVVEGHCQQGAR